MPYQLRGPDQLSLLQSILDPHTTIRLIKDPHGGHAISRIVVKIPSKDSRFIFDAAVREPLTLQPAQCIHSPNMAS
jgi:hypothetical protein